MNNTLTPQELIAVARCLTHFQADIADYELTHYGTLTAAQRSGIEHALAALAATAGRLYAYSVQLEFAQAQQQIRKLQEASVALKHFLKTVEKIQQVLDAVTVLADLADAIMSHDVEAVTSDIDNIIRMIAKD